MNSQVTRGAPVRRLQHALTQSALLCPEKKSLPDAGVGMTPLGSFIYLFNLKETMVFKSAT